jgi:antitoxin MazE
MQTKIQRWGNSLAVRIPKVFAEGAGLSAGTQVQLKMREDGFLVRPTRALRPRLRDLLRGVKRSNRHAEVKTGKRVGREIW